MHKIYAFIILCLTLFGTPLHAKETSEDCLAVAIYSESRAESPQGMLAVATVVMNRVDDPRYPKTVCKVVREGKDGRCQFQGLCNKPKIEKRDNTQWKVCLEIARNVLHLGERSNILEKHAALWFHNGSVRPSWSKVKRRILVLGGHKFYGDSK